MVSAAKSSWTTPRCQATSKCYPISDANVRPASRALTARMVGWVTSRLSSFSFGFLAAFKLCSRNGRLSGQTVHERRNVSEAVTGNFPLRMSTRLSRAHLRPGHRSLQLGSLPQQRQMHRRNRCQLHVHLPGGLHRPLVRK